MATEIVRQMHSAFEVPGPATKISMIVFWVLFVVSVFGLPTWSYLFNDLGGYGAQVCMEAAGDVTCTNGVENYVHLARELGRVRENGSLWGCGCEQGVFSDWACRSTGSAYFSVSYYISTAPGTGAFAAFSAFPILFIWLYGGNNINTMGPFVRGDRAEDKHNSLGIITISQALFQVFFGTFLFVSVCVFPTAHGVATCLFLGAEGVHWLALVCSADTTTRQGMMIVGLMALGFVATGIGMTVSSMADPSTANWFQLHAFYLGEAFGLSLTTGFPVFLVFSTPSTAKGESQPQQPLTASTWIDGERDQLF